MDFAEEVKSLAAKARERDPGFHRFGALSHKYQFNPTIGIELIHEFETERGLTLPDAYVLYLTEIGNGGAGPNYGLFPLEKVKGFYNPDVEIFFDRTDIPDVWEEVCRVYDEAFENDGDEYLKIEERVLNGSVIIGTPGCTMYTVLMCAGKNYGKIGVVDLDMVEYAPPSLSDKTFEEWILEYFRKAANGEIIEE